MSVPGTEGILALPGTAWLLVSRGHFVWKLVWLTATALLWAAAWEGSQAGLL